MIPILSSGQTREWDQYTIKNEPVASYDLMERASNAFVERFIQIFPNKKLVRVFCGVGNNGGDGLAIGRVLKEKGWEVLKYVVGNPKDGTTDFNRNLDQSDLYAMIKEEKDIPDLANDDIVIDGLFGSGLSRPLDGLHKKVVDKINRSPSLKVTIDVASGLFIDRSLASESTVVRPDYTISFQTPKLPFFLPDTDPYVGQWYVENIGLHVDYLHDITNDFSLTEQKDLYGVVPKRGKFTHKTEVGKLLVVAGSKGKIGASVLCTKAALVSGAGLINVCSPSCGTDILQVSIPEVMVIEDPCEDRITKIPKLTEPIVIGPGMGTGATTMKAFEKLLKEIEQPVVIDADGINMLSKKKSLLNHVPRNAILTPHPGEFKRLVGSWENDYEKLEKLQKICVKYSLNMVLKGAYSAICSPEGKIYFNPTGNPVLATAGSGDVLSGVIASYLAQGMIPLEALKLGVYLHGLAADLAIEEAAYHSITASQIIHFLPDAVRNLLKSSPLD